MALQIRKFRALFNDLPQDEEDPCDLEDCVCILLISGNHYCTVIFTPREKRIHILGRAYTINRKVEGANNWNEWGGPRIWARVCKLYGWSPTQFMGLVVNSVDWVQNGYDCGPIACQVTESLWISGLSLDGDGLWKRPNFPCCHSLRLNMATRIHQLAADGHRSFLFNKESLHRQQMDDFLEGHTDQWADFEDEIRDNLSQHPRYALISVEADLRKAISSCHSCKKRLLERTSYVRTQIAHKPGTQSMMLPNDAQALLEGTVSKNACIENLGEVVDTSLQNTYLNDSGDHSSASDFGQGAPGGEKPTHATLQIIDWKQARIGRFSRPKQGPVLPVLENLHGLRHAFSRDYDNYTDGPTLDVLDPIPDTVMPLAQLSLVYIANKVITTPWTLFKDYGYRLLPDFCQMFWLSQPNQVREHLSPVGLSNPPPAFTFHNPLKTNRSGHPIIPNDRIVLGAEELLELADDTGTDRPLLTGRLEDGSYVYLDLERDRINPQDVYKACDIDSLIWITRKPKFNGSIGVYELPVIRKKPPIWKNNHVMVELLYPQSEDDRLNGGLRGEWQVKSFRLSTIPHLSFGALSQSTSVAELILFFPRMTHRHPHLGRWENMIPSDIQNFFWDRVLLPAMKVICTPIQEPYVTLDREHAAFKQKHSGKKSMGQTSAKRSLHTKDLTKLIEQMEEIVGVSFPVTGPQNLSN